MIVPPKKPKSKPNIKVLDSMERRTAEYKSFLKHVSDTTGVASYEQLALVWPAIQQGALEWLVVRKKSVDLGFAILHPCPLRANWKSILLAKFPKLGPILHGKSQANKEKMLELSGFDVSFFDSKLLALMGDRLVMWRLEVEPKRSWWRAMLTQEAYVFNALGSLSYAEYIAKRISDLRVKILRLYFSFLREVSYPMARVFSGRSGKRTFLGPYVERGKVRPLEPEHGDVYPVVELKKPAPKPERFSLARVSPVTGLQAMPRVQPEAEDVRSDLGLKFQLPD